MGQGGTLDAFDGRHAVCINVEASARPLQPAQEETAMTRHRLDPTKRPPILLVRPRRRPRAHLHLSIGAAAVSLWLALRKVSVRGFKRLIDVTVSAAALLVISPLLLLVAAAIRLESAGSVFFSQVRVGRHGRHFRMYKFRSMSADAERLKKKLAAQNESAGGVTFKIKRDPRITRMGRIIRKLSVDELPQLWNVLRGDMSLVGPRPPVPQEVALYTLQERRRLDVTPGLTCIWQVSGRSDLAFDQQVELDLRYISSRNLLGDCKLLLQTIPAVLGGKGAY
jgi:lipopolysaccharide/colanic/teichoic acid biosynthesis glycosyltransferase